MNLIFVIVSTVMFSPSFCDDFDYCQLKCSGKKHTMCAFQGVGDKCQDYRGADINDEVKKLLVDKHNEMRRDIAKGKKYKQSHPELPKAANMMKLQWREESARVAQRWADQCTYDHDLCRKLQDMDYGQNMAKRSSTALISEMPYVSMLEMLYDEIVSFNKSYIDIYVPQKGTGHFTQMIWAKTEYVGCGASFYKLTEKTGKNYVLLVCNYGPRGNMKRANLYKIGDPCTACPKGTTCDDGLCAKSETPTVIQKGEPCSACPEGATCDIGLCAVSETPTVIQKGEPCSACPEGATCDNGLCAVSETPTVMQKEEPCSACPEGATCNGGLCSVSETPPLSAGGKFVPTRFSVILFPILCYFIVKTY